MTETAMPYPIRHVEIVTEEINRVRDLLKYAFPSADHDVSLIDDDDDRQVFDSNGRMVAVVNANLALAASEGTMIQDVIKGIRAAADKLEQWANSEQAEQEE